MAQTEYTGRLIEFIWDTGGTPKTLAGLKRVEVDESDGPDAEQLDVTVALDNVYTFLTDPLGAKGDDKATVTVELQDSTQAVDDSMQTTIAFNTAAAVSFDTSKGVTNANEWTHSTLELTKRVTKIMWADFATCTLTLEANALGTWGSP